MILCGDLSAHERAYPEDLEILWDAHTAEVAMLLDIEETHPLDATAWDYHNVRANALWDAIEDRAVKRVKPVIPVILGKTSKTIDFAALKERLDLVEYVERYTVLRQYGRMFKGKCPLPAHDDKTASFTVYPESKSWWCFGCRQGSDIFDFADKMNSTKASDLAEL